MAAIVTGVTGVSGVSGVSGVAGSWFLSSGVICFFVVLLLSIVLTALCSDCNRQSFELQDSEVDKNPSALISVVKLEETVVARENPMINEIQSDEKDFDTSEENSVQFTPWRSHLGALKSNRDVWTNGNTAVMETPSFDNDTTGESSTEEISVQLTLWRSHLGAPQQKGVNSSTPPHCDHTYHTIGEGPSGADVSSAPTNPEPEAQPAAATVADLSDSQSVYTQVRKVRQAPPPVPTAKMQQVEEEHVPALPDRETVTEG